MYKLFIVEDDAGIARAVAGLAEKWGLEACICGDLTRVAEEFAACQPHIVLLDVMLPFFNGYYWCAQLRKISKAPIIFLSSASDSMNIVMAMNMGADDFILNVIIYSGGSACIGWSKSCGKQPKTGKHGLVLVHSAFLFCRCVSRSTRRSRAVLPAARPYRPRPA